MNNQQQIKTIQSNMNNLMILLIVGAVAEVVTIIIDGIYTDTIIWGLAVIVGFQFYRLTNIFINNSSIELLNKMDQFQKIFIITWVLAGATTALLGFFEIDSLLGVVIVIAATFLMNNILQVGQEMVNPQRPPMQSNTGRATRFCSNCGEETPVNNQFCGSCGKPLD